MVPIREVFLEEEGLSQAVGSESEFREGESGAVF